MLVSLPPKGAPNGEPLTPSVKPSVCQLPHRGSLLARFINSYIKPASLREVNFAKQKTEGVSLS